VVQLTEWMTVEHAAKLMSVEDGTIQRLLDKKHMLSR
jgi:excisionase family DNA binding protein